MEFSIKKINKINFSLALIALFLLTSIFIIKPYNDQEEVIASDVISYYAYLPATFIYGDITLEFTENYQGDHHFTFWPYLNEDGEKVIKTSSGLSIMYLPFFAIGHAAAHLFDYDTGGYSSPYKFCLQMGLIIYLLTGLYFLAKVLRRYFSQTIVAFTLAGIVLCTNLLFYSVMTIYSHTYSFALMAAFLFLTIKWHENPNFKNSLFVGLLTGLISLIRPTNVIILVLFIFYDVSSLDAFKEKVLYLLKSYYKILIMLTGFFIIWLPQFVYWKLVTDEFFFYSYGKEGFFFDNPQITNTLFSFRNGLYIYAPIMLVSLVGLFILHQYSKKWFLSVLIFFCFNLFVVSSWWCWWYTGFGNRAFIDSYSIMALPFAATLAWLKSRRNIIKYLSYMLIICAGVLGMYHNLQYHYGTIHFDSMTRKAYIANFLKLEYSPEYKYLLKSPRVDDALEGKYTSTQLYPFDAFHLANEYEESFKEFLSNNQVQSDTLHIDFDNAENIRNSRYAIINYEDDLTSDKALSGLKSLELTPEDPYSLEVTIDSINEGDRLTVSAWKFGEGFEGHLVITAKKNFYKSMNVHHQEESEWRKISLHTYLPDNLPENKIMIYFWNSGKETIYFDNLSVRVDRVKN